MGCPACCLDAQQFHPVSSFPCASFSSGGRNHELGNQDIIYIPQKPQKRHRVWVKYHVEVGSMAACGRLGRRGFLRLITVVKLSRGRPRPVRRPVNHARHGSRRRSLRLPPYGSPGRQEHPLHAVSLVMLERQFTQRRRGAVCGGERRRDKNAMCYE